MNLKKLFEMQKVLDDRIVKEKGLEGVDLLPMKILALQTELGECANEWRGFKFWSEDQKARTDHECKVCEGEGSINLEIEENETHTQITYLDCQYCNGDGYLDKNPLLEEYVDCLHFILSIGLEMDCEIEKVTTILKHDDVLNQFIECFQKLFVLQEQMNKYRLVNYLQVFIGLGEMLGFTTEQIEQAYLDKNSTNHERQANGY